MADSSSSSGDKAVALAQEGVGAFKLVRVYLDLSGLSLLQEGSVATRRDEA